MPKDKVVPKKKRTKHLRKRIEDPYDKELYEFAHMRPIGDIGKSNEKSM